MAMTTYRRLNTDFVNLSTKVLMMKMNQKTKKRKLTLTKLRKMDRRYIIMKIDSLRNVKEGTLQRPKDGVKAMGKDFRGSIAMKKRATADKVKLEDFDIKS